MNQPRVKKAVLRRAESIVVDTLTPIFEEALNNVSNSIDSLITPRPLPVVTFNYPAGGRGPRTTRVVRVTEMTETHLKGFQIQDEYDEEPGTPHTYLVSKMGMLPQLLHLASE